LRPRPGCRWPPPPPARASSPSAGAPPPPAPGAATDAADAGDQPGDQPELQRAWLARFPAQAVNFELPDFSFWRIAPRDARFVAGFGRIHNLSAAQLLMAAQA